MRVVAPGLLQFLVVRVTSVSVLQEIVEEERVLVYPLHWLYQERGKRLAYC